MTSRERMRRALEHEEVDRLPRDLWYVPYIPMFRNDELERFRSLYPLDFAGTAISFGKSHYAKGESCRKGSYTDDFGSIWEVLEDGIAGEVKEPVIKTMADLDNYRLPWEIVNDMDTSGQAAAYRESDGFVLASTHANPFERMQFLRGTEQLMCDIALEDPVFLKLKDMLHEFNVKEMKAIAKTAVDGIAFSDDWGSQNALLISPSMWRKHFKPLYKEYCDIIHSNGKYALFHSDGYTEAIIPDLIEIGVNALNTQLFCMDIEKIASQYAGKMTFWGELDRQWILPFGTEEEVRESVRRLKRNFCGQKLTGFIAELSWETLTPYQNVVAAYDEFLKP